MNSLLAAENIDERYKPVELYPVPEINVEGLARIGAKIRALRTLQRKPGFGAYLLRGAGEKVAYDFALQMKDGDPSGMNMSSFFYSAGTLHRDGAVRNSLTAHVITKGSVEAFILAGSEPDVLGSRRKEVMDQLVYNGLIDISSGLPMPDHVLHATLGVNDVLLFDHSQAHAFVNSTTNRIAKAYY